MLWCIDVSILVSCQQLSYFSFHAFFANFCDSRCPPHLIHFGPFSCILQWWSAYQSLVRHSLIPLISYFLQGTSFLLPVQAFGLSVISMPPKLQWTRDFMTNAQWTRSFGQAESLNLVTILSLFTFVGLCLCPCLLSTAFLLFHFIPFSPIFLWSSIPTTLETLCSYSHLP